MPAHRAAHWKSLGTKLAFLIRDNFRDNISPSAFAMPPGQFNLHLSKKVLGTFNFFTAFLNTIIPSEGKVQNTHHPRSRPTGARLPPAIHQRVYPAHIRHLSNLGDRDNRPRQSRHRSECQSDERTQHPSMCRQS